MRLKSSDVWVSFFIVMALTTNVAFVYTWDMLHLTLAMFFNIAATIAKYKMKRDELGNVTLGVGLVADLHLIPAFFLGLSVAMATGKMFGSLFVPTAPGILPPEAVIGAVGLAIGAMIANFVSVIILVADEVWKHTQRGYKPKK